MNSDVNFITEEERIRPEKSEVYRLRCDNSKIKEFTGYAPKVDIRNGLKKTIEWIVKPENMQRYKAEIYNV